MAELPTPRPRRPEPDPPPQRDFVRRLRAVEDELKRLHNRQGDAAIKPIWGRFAPDPTRDLNFILDGGSYWLPLDGPAGQQQRGGGVNNFTGTDGSAWGQVELDPGTDPAPVLIVPPEEGYYIFGCVLPHIYLGDGGVGSPAGGSQYADGEMFEINLMTCWAGDSTGPPSSPIFAFNDCRNIRWSEKYQSAGQRGIVPAVGLTGFDYFVPGSNDYVATHIGLFLSFEDPASTPDVIAYALNSGQLQPWLWAIKVPSGELGSVDV